LALCNCIGLPWTGSDTHLHTETHHGLRGHSIVIPQDPGPLLHILPSPELRLNDLIKVFWLGSQPPTDTDLNPFLVVRKEKVLTALQYLVRHNHPYHGLAVNWQMMDSWSDNFIPPELRDNIIHLSESDHHEREGYTVDLGLGNYENDLQAAQDDDFRSNDSGLLLTGSVSTDINGERRNPDTRMLDTLLDVVTTRERPSDQEQLEGLRQCIHHPPLTARGYRSSPIGSMVKLHRSIAGQTPGISPPLSRYCFH
jgi:hypothetical protein